MNEKVWVMVSDKVHRARAVTTIVHKYVKENTLLPNLTANNNYNTNENLTTKYTVRWTV